MASVPGPLAAILLCVGCSHPAPPEAAAGAASSRNPGAAEARAFYLRAAVAGLRGDTTEVVRGAEWVVRLDRDPLAAARAAELLRRSGELVRAERMALGALAAAPVGPASAEAYRVVGLARLELGDRRAALEALDRAGDRADVWAAAIEAERALGDAAAARARLERWRASAADDPLAWAESALRLGLADDAYDVARGLVDDGVVGADAFDLAFRAGLARCDLRDVHTLAVERAARAADPRWRETLRDVADRSGDLELGRRIRAIAGDPGEAEDDVAAAADRLLANGEPEAVLLLTASGLHEPSIAWVRAGALAVLGRVDEAVDLARRTSADPVDVIVREATIRELAGEPDAFAPVLEALHEPCPVAAWVALAARAEGCAGARYAEAALAVRAADRDLLARVDACAPRGAP